MGFAHAYAQVTLEARRTTYLVTDSFTKSHATVKFGMCDNTAVLIDTVSLHKSTSNNYVELFAQKECYIVRLR